MTNKSTDAQIALLRSGLRRPDHCIVAPTGKGASAKKSMTKMIDVGWLKEVKAKAGAPVWRTDEKGGASYALKLTAAGLKVASSKEQTSRTDPTPTAPVGDEGDDDQKSRAVKVGGQEGTRSQPNFREGSKLAQVMTLLRRDGGVAIDELSAAMNWLPHSTRAVLTGLRKRGVLVARRKAPHQRTSAYFVDSNDVRASGQE